VLGFDEHVLCEIELACAGPLGGHYGRVEAMEWAESSGEDYIFGLGGNAALDARLAETADNLRFHHAASSEAKLRTYASFMYQAGIGIAKPKRCRRRC
jgi:DDE family transposase